MIQQLVAGQQAANSPKHCGQAACGCVSAGGGSRALTAPTGHGFEGWCLGTVLPCAYTQSSGHSEGYFWPFPAISGYEAYGCGKGNTGCGQDGGRVASHCSGRGRRGGAARFGDLPTQNVPCAGPQVDPTALGSPQAWDAFPADWCLSRSQEAPVARACGGTRDACGVTGTWPRAQGLRAIGNGNNKSLGRSCLQAATG